MAEIDDRKAAQRGSAARRRRDERYFAAVGRQLLLHDRGGYERRDWLGVVFHCTPAPVDEFLRVEHRGLRGDPGIDFRSYAREARRQRIADSPPANTFDPPF